MTSSVFVTNVDDYLAPSQACVNPLFTAPSNKDDDQQNKQQQQQHHDDSAPPAVVVPRRRRRRLQPAVPNTNDNNTEAMDIDGGDKGQPTTAASNLLKHANKFVVNLSTPSTNDSFTDTNDVAAATTTTSVVKATMADCLACSGCITTTETVLVEQHSLTALRKLCVDLVGEKDIVHVTLVVTISPAVWSDLLRHLGLLPTTTSSTTTSSTYLLEWQRRLVTWWYHFFHVSIVIDGNVPLQWSLTEAANEFCSAYQKHRASPAMKQDESTHNMSSSSNGHKESTQDTSWDLDSLPSIALSAHQTQYMLPDGTTKIVTHSPSSSDKNDVHNQSQRQLPLFTSSCPALVCLVEKSTSSITPTPLSPPPPSSAQSPLSLSSSSPASIANLATTQSPMSMSGVWVKQILGSRQGATDVKTHQRRVRHVAVMPCHDKKLEASRKDFLYPITTTTTITPVVADGNGLHVTMAEAGATEDGLEPSVDLVITTQEWWTLITETMEQQNQLQHNGNTAVPDNGSNVKDIQTWLESFPMSPIMNLDQLAPDEAALCPRENAVFLADIPMMTEHETVHLESTAVPMDVDSEAPNESQPTVFTKGSGGYADFVFCHAAKQLFGYKVPSDQLPWTPFSTTTSSQQPVLRGRRRRLADSKPNDMYQLRLFQHGDGSFSCHGKNPATDRVVLRFGMAYGLQNVQRMLQHGTASSNQTLPTSAPSLSSLSPSFPVFDYVEAMACPMGCVNGGGQIRVAPRETPSETRQRVTNTQQIFSLINMAAQAQDQLQATDENDGDDVQFKAENGDSTNGHTTTSSKMPGASPHKSYSGPDKRLLHTRYHNVLPLQYTQGAAAGVAVSDLRW